MGTEAKRSILKAVDIVVFNGMKEEAAGGCGGSGERTIARRENRRNIFKADIAASDVEHGADKVAHHVVKESVASDAIDEEMKAVGDLFAPR